MGCASSRSSLEQTPQPRVMAPHPPPASKDGDGGLLQERGILGGERAHSHIDLDVAPGGSRLEGRGPAGGLSEGGAARRVEGGGGAAVEQ